MGRQAFNVEAYGILVGPVSIYDGPLTAQRRKPRLSVSVAAHRRGLCCTVRAYWAREALRAFCRLALFRGALLQHVSPMCGARSCCSFLTTGRLWAACYRPWARWARSLTTGTRSLPPLRPPQLPDTSQQNCKRSQDVEGWSGSRKLHSVVSIVIRRGIA